MIIAQIGVNHNGKLNLARKLIDAAKDAGADAVKFQTFITEKLVTVDGKKAAYQKENDPASTQFAMMKELELSEDDFRKLINYCKQVDIKFMSTPLEETSADLLEKLGVDNFQMTSGDLNNLPLLMHVAKKKIPMTISTGMANLNEVKQAVEVIEQNGNPELSILHCHSSYPAIIEECNMKAIQTLKKVFNKPTGWSDHTTSNVTSIMAVSLGAEIIKKNLTLDNDMVGPKHKYSANAKHFKHFVNSLRMAQLAMGDGSKKMQPGEVDIANFAKKSLTAKTDIKAGEILDHSNIVALRPAGGISALDYDRVFGRSALINIKKGTQINFDMM